MKHIELKHDDTVAELSIRRTACWFNNSNCCAALEPHLCRISYVFSLVRTIKNQHPRKSTSTQARNIIAAVLPHKHYLIIYAGVGPIELVHGSLPVLPTGVSPFKICICLFFRVHTSISQLDH